MNRILILAQLYWVVTSAGLSGCDSEEPDKHDVTVGWRISGIAVCQSPPLPQLDNESLTFETMRIEVFEEDEVGNQPVISVNAPCDKYEYTLTNLERGTYVVRIDAMAEWEDEESAFFRAEMDIESPADEDKYLGELLIGTGSVRAQWEFESGFCVGNDVATVSITLTNASTKAETTIEKIECASEIQWFNDVPWDVYSLSILGFDEDGAQTHSGETESDFEVLPGSKVKRVVTLE